jgi:hypothetical protein
LFSRPRPGRPDGFQKMSPKMLPNPFVGPKLIHIFNGVKSSAGF